jgi:hypothetical protein
MKIIIRPTIINCWKRPAHSVMQVFRLLFFACSTRHSKKIASNFLYARVCIVFSRLSRSGGDKSGDLGGQTFREIMRSADIPIIEVAVRVAARLRWNRSSSSSSSSASRLEMNCLISWSYCSAFTIRWRKLHYSHADVKLHTIIQL